MAAVASPFDGPEADLSDLGTDSDADSLGDDASGSEMDSDSGEPSSPQGARPVVADAEAEAQNLAELSDSSDEEEGPLIRVGNVPREWYQDFDHIGYNVDGKRVKRTREESEISKLMDRADNPDWHRTIYDYENDRAVVLSKDELRLIHRLRQGRSTSSAVNNEALRVQMGLIHAPKTPQEQQESMMSLWGPSHEPKRRFVQSKHEGQRILRMVRAIRNGWIVTDEERERRRLEADKPFDIWAAAEDPDAARYRPPPALAAPKLAPPTHAESYNPPPEYVFTAEEEAAWRDEDPEDRELSFLPQSFASLRRVPFYQDFIQERFQRCLDLYMCPRTRRKKVQVAPESLIPKVDPAQLRPFPSKLAFDIRAHRAPVTALTASPSGEWLASGASDGTLRVWEFATGRNFREWKLPGAIACLRWCPVASLPLLLVACRSAVYVMHTGCGSDKQNAAALEVLSQRAARPAVPMQQDGAGAAAAKKVAKWKFLKVDRIDRELDEAEWTDDEEEEADAADGDSAAQKQQKKKQQKKNKDQEEEDEQEVDIDDPVIREHPWRVRLRITVHNPVIDVCWHGKGDFFASIDSGKQARSLLVHKLSIRQSQQPFRKAKGDVRRVLFHPTAAHFFIVGQRSVHIWDLVQQKIVKKLRSSAEAITSAALHPSGDHLLVGSADRRVLWFDLDLSDEPFKTMRYHEKAINSVAIHRRLPLFASAGDDGNVHVFHGQVFSDLLTDPRIVAVKILKGGLTQQQGASAASGFTAAASSSSAAAASTDAPLPVRDIAWHATQPWLASSGEDGRVRIYH